MTWNRLQSASGADATTSTSVVATYTSNLGSGNKLIACVQTGGSSVTVKDAAGNSFVQLASVTPSGGVPLYLFALDTPAGDVGTKPAITASWLASVRGCIIIQEVSGLAVGNTLALMIDGTPGTTSGSGGSPIGSPSYSSTVAGEYLFSVVATDTTDTWTAPANLTADTANIAGNGFNNIAIGYSNSTGGTESAAWTQTATGNAWGSILCAFQLTGGISLGPRDIPQIQPGPAWLDYFKPGLPRPRPPTPPVTQIIGSSGSFTLAPLAFSAQGAQSSPDVPRINPGPVWLDIFKPGLPKPRPAVLPSSPPGGQGNFIFAPLRFSGQASQTSPDLREILPGPTWLALLKPGLPKPSTISPPSPLNPVTGSGLFALAPLAFAASGTVLPVVTSAGSFALAPLAFSGIGAEENLFVFIGHYSVDYLDYADSNTLQTLAVKPQQSYEMYVVSSRPGLTVPPGDGRWLGYPGLGDEVVFFHHGKLIAGRIVNAELHAAAAIAPVTYPEPVPVPPVPERVVAPSGLAGARAVNAERQARLARGEVIEPGEGEGS